MIANIIILQIFKKLIYLHLFTYCFMKIPPETVIPEHIWIVIKLFHITEK